MRLGGFLVNPAEISCEIETLPEVAEAIVGRRLAEDGRMERISVGEQEEQRTKFLRSDDGWIRWLLDESERRTISPESELIDQAAKK